MSSRTLARPRARRHPRPSTPRPPYSLVYQQKHLNHPQSDRTCLHTLRRLLCVPYTFCTVFMLSHFVLIVSSDHICVPRSHRIALVPLDLPCMHARGRNGTIARRHRRGPALKWPEGGPRCWVPPRLCGKSVDSLLSAPGCRSPVLLLFLNASRSASLCANC